MRQAAICDKIRYMRYNKPIIALILALFILLPASAPVLSVRAYGAGFADGYADYVLRVANARRETDIAANGFEILQEYRYPVTHDTLGDLEFVPAIDRGLGRVVLFFIDAGGEIAFRTDDVESNCWFQGEPRQPNVGVPGIALRDLDGDGLVDIVLICECENPAGAYAELDDVVSAVARSVGQNGV